MEEKEWVGEQKRIILLPYPNTSSEGRETTEFPAFYFAECHTHLWARIGSRKKEIRNPGRTLASSEA